jgi:hypothetical protein
MPGLKPRPIARLHCVYTETGGIFAVSLYAGDAGEDATRRFFVLN